jgi:hypothetical protein
MSQKSNWSYDQNVNIFLLINMFRVIPSSEFISSQTLNNFRSNSNNFQSKIVF